MKKILFTALLLLSFISANVSFSQVSPPTLLQPPNNATGVSTTPLLDWTDVSGATSYRVQVLLGITIVIDHANLPTSQYQILPSEALQPNTVYNWRAAAVGTNTLWSGYFSFTTGLTAPLPPILTLPGNGATNVSLTPTFEWQPSAGATTYQIQVAINPNFNPTSIDVPGLTSTQYVVTPQQQLAPGTGYYWRVRAWNQGGFSDWSTIWSFSTVPSPPNPPTLQLPPNNATGVSLTPLMQWSLVFGATAYRLQIATDANFANTIHEVTITAIQYNVPPGVLGGNTTYYWHVAAQNSGGWGSYSAPFHFTTQIGPPAAPILAAPPDGDTTVSRFPLLDWNDVPGTTTYRVQVATDAGFANLVQNNVTNVSQFQVTQSVLQSNTWYYWRVNATNNGGTGAWSVTWHFRTLPQAPPVPTLVSPPNGQQGVSLTPTLVWNSSPGAEYYTVQVATNTNFNSPVVNTTTASTQYSVPPGRLQGGTIYYWRVNAINSGGTSGWSTVWNFRTLSTLSANLKLYLEGFYNGSSQVQDTISVYLANPTSPWAFRDSTLALLQTNGNAMVSFQRAPDGNYYIVIKHRNHLETWSALPQSFSTGTPVNYDFTTASNKAYGNNMKQVGSVWVLYSGDINQDGFVDPEDYNAFISQFGKDGYISADLNGDTYGDGYDLPYLYPNFFKNKARP